MASLCRVVIGPAAACGLLLGSSAAFGAVLYEQSLGSTPNGFPSLVDGAQSADDFRLPGSGDPVSITGIRWYGVLFDSDTSATFNSADFEVRFFADDGFPDTNPTDTISAANLSGTATSTKDVADDTVLQFDLNLASPISLLTGTPLYLSVVADFGADFSKKFYWSTTDSDADAVNFFRDFEGLAWLDYPGYDLAFSLESDDTTAPVPTPTPLALIAAGGLAALWGRRRAPGR